MRLLTALAISLSLVSMSSVYAQSSRDACAMVDAGVLETTLGTTPEIAEQSGAGTGMSFCHWRGGDETGVRVHSITAASQGIVGGTPLQYFTQHQADDVERLGAGNVAPLGGPWQAAQLVDVTTEPNPQQFFSITFINKDDTVTVETYGMPKQTTISLASAIAEAM